MQRLVYVYNLKKLHVKTHTPVFQSGENLTGLLKAFEKTKKDSENTFLSTTTLIR